MPELCVSIETQSPAETRYLGRRLARHLRAGDVVALVGGLGSGKTVMTQGVCEGLGVTARVRSATFVIMSEYRGRDYPVYHFDLYRIDDPTELHQIGYIEYVYGGGITIIEWAQKVIEDLPADRIEIELIRTGATQREIRFTSYPSSFPAHEIVGSFRNGG